MTHTAKAEFILKNQESKDRFITFCNGDNGLSVTRAWKGCQSVDFYEATDNSMKVTIWQKWDTQADRESYVKFRHDSGLFDFLGELLESPPVITALKPLLFQTDREQIEQIIRDMCNTDHQMGMRHMDDNCLFIRPTGNPLTKETWNQMMTNSDVSVELNELVQIQKLEVCGDMAYVCYTNHGKFSYKGTPNDDLAVLTSVLQRIEGEWKVVHGQRSTGRSPTDTPPSFPEN